MCACMRAHQSEELKEICATDITDKIFVYGIYKECLQIIVTKQQPIWVICQSYKPATEKWPINVWKTVQHLHN